MYKIIYGELVGGKAFLSRRPGKQPYICFDKKEFKGNLDRTLDALIKFMDADRTLTKREKLQKRVIFLEDINNPAARGVLGFDKPVTVRDQAPDFCRN